MPDTLTRRPDSPAQQGATQEPTLTQLPAQVEELRHKVREFAQQRLRPAVQRLDQAPAADFDWELVAEAHTLGLTRLVIPRQLGGLGYGELGVAVALEELAAVDAGIALIFGATMLGQAPRPALRRPALQARFLPLFSGDDPVLACNAITEDLAGCDLLIPENAEYAIDVMSARREGDHYVLNGAKKFITNGKVAHYATVFANIEGHDRGDRADLLRRPPGHPGDHPRRGRRQDGLPRLPGHRAALRATSASPPRTSSAARAAASTSTSRR